MPQRKVTVYRAKEHEADTVARVEANPCPPHRRFAADDRRHGRHLRGKVSITGMQLLPAKRVYEVDDAE